VASRSASPGRALASLVPDSVRQVQDIRVDGGVLLFAVALTVLLSARVRTGAGVARRAGRSHDLATNGCRSDRSARQRAA
jgi:hypothetical protein